MTKIWNASVNFFVEMKKMCSWLMKDVINVGLDITLLVEASTLV